jgi:hypothetical protein
MSEKVYAAEEDFKCQELSDAVLLCHDEHKDWRKCKQVVRAFRECIERYEAEEKR